MVINTFGSPSSLLAQCDAIGGFITTDDSTRCVGEATRLLLHGYRGFITWQSSPSGLNSWLSVTSDTSNQVYVYPLENTDYRAHVTIPGCNDDYSTVITVNVLTTGISLATGYTGNRCGLEFDINAESPSGTWSKLAGPGNIEFSPSATNPDPIVSADSFGLFVFAWTVGAGGCAAANITNYPQNKATAIDSIQHCWSSSKILTMNATLSNPDASGIWTSVSVPMSITNPTSPNALVEPPNVGTFKVRWIENYFSCTDDTIITLFVQRQPVATIGAIPAVCDNINSLSATDTWGTVNYWQRFSGPGNLNFTDSLSINTEVIAEEFGEYTVLWVTKNFFCSDTDFATINFYEQPVTSAITPDDACGTNAVLTGYKSTGSSAVNRLWSNVSGVSNINNINIINDSVVSVNIQPGSYGNYTFRWKEINGICSDSADVSLTFFEQPVAKAGNDIDSCGSRIRLSAEPSVNGSSTLWSVPGHETNITFSNPTSNIATASSDSYLPFLFVWTEINSICTSSDTLAVEFIQVPEAFAGENDSICGFTYELKATQSISNSSGNWTAVAGLDTIFLSNNFTTSTNVSSAGTYRYIWAESNKKCISTDNVEVTFFDQPQAEILEAEDACGTNQIITVESINDNTGNWELISGRGTAFFNPSGVSNKYTLEVSDTGAYIVRWSAFNNMCADDTTFTISFYAEPEADAGPDIETCGNTIELTSGKSIGTGTWHKISGNGDVVFDYISDTTFIATSDRYGTFILSWQVENGACIIDDRIVAKFFEMPVADAGSDTLICGSAISLNASPANGYWSVLEGSGKLSFSPDTTSATITLNTQSAGIYKLLWSATNDICSDTSSVSIHFLQKPLANAGIDQTLNNKFETELQATEPQNSEFGEWALLSGTGDLINGNSAITTVKSLSLGENIFEWSVINSIDHSCRSSDSLFITVYDIFIPEVITPNGDSENDFFVITGIEDISRVEVTVFNRWGIEVFYSADYKNKWGGTNKNGELLTNDTYFYVVDVAGTRIFKGFVVIKK